ncbi:methyl-accepting chemotaxis protein [Rheinheimera sp. NSM]|uniref:methyl-accepting chemotaxis protein n=1 Tax=Rheinheimera sp. NSM TaxID=3457884 RepID=UPI0040367E6C
MLRKLKIGRRLAAVFTLMVLLSIIVGSVAMYRFSETEANLHNIADRRLPASLLVGDMNREFLLMRLYTLNVLYASTAADRQQAQATLQSAMRKYSEAENGAAAFHQTAAGSAVFNQAVTAKQQYDQLHRQLLALMDQGQSEQAEQFRHQGINEVARKVTEALRAVAAYQQTTAHQQAESAKHSIELATSNMIAIVVLAVVLAVALGLMVSRSLVRPMSAAVSISQRIAAGQLNQSFADDEPDEAGEMIRAMAQMQQQLRTTVHEINHSSSQLAATSEELSAVTEQSSRTLHQQSEELEQGATAVTELTTAIEEVARSAASTSRDSEIANDKARQGQERVNDTIDTIQALDSELQSSRLGIEKLAARVKDIGSVLDVIRAIAEQTNLLALNAAIEAARAGDSGRGFAVVADEVRALAHRTQESTKEIERMMHAVQAETHNTVESMSSCSGKATETLQIAQQAGEALQLIAEAIGQISDQNLTIASAAEQQATVAREVDRNLVNIRDLSLQTSAGANETQASSAELARLAQSLSELINHFRV